jgi:hypothetical protein
MRFHLNDDFHLQVQQRVFLNPTDHILTCSYHSRIRDCTNHTISYRDICVLRMSSCSGDADFGGVLSRTFVAMVLCYLSNIFLVFQTHLPIIPVAQTGHDQRCDYQYFRSQANHVTLTDEYEGTRGVNVCLRVCFRFLHT